MIEYDMIQERFLKRDPFLYGHLSRMSKLIGKHDRTCLMCQDHLLNYEKEMDEETLLYFTGCCNCRTINVLGTKGRVLA